MLESSWASPLKKHRFELFNTEVSIAVFVKQRVYDFNNVWVDFRIGYPFCYVRKFLAIKMLEKENAILTQYQLILSPSIWNFSFCQHALPVNSIFLGIQKEHGTFQICSSKENIIEGFESFKSYSLSCVTFFLYPFDLLNMKFN